MKFGGGCLKDGEHFRKVAEIIESQTDPVAVVVSAVSGVTDLLADGIWKAKESEKNVPEIIESVNERHREIAHISIGDENVRQKIAKDFERKIRILKRLLFGISYTEEITESVRAHVLSYGERFSALMLSGVLKSHGRMAVALEADKIGIMTDESYTNATAILPEVSRNLDYTVWPLVREGQVPILTGYFGCTHEGKVTTFGRNGSDYSAAAVAHGMNARLLEIWKDVDGFMSADPEIVKSPRRIDRLSYYEAAELSYFGSQILHPRTVEPLVNVCIPVHIRNIYQTEGAGTRIMPEGCEKENVVKSVTYNNHISMLKIHGPGVGYKPGIIAEIGGILSRMGINIYSVITSQTCINLLLDKKDSRKSHESIKRITGGVIEKVNLEESIALIAVVGEGLLKRKGVAARVFSAVAEQDINVEMISSGASEVAYYFVVKICDVRKAVNAIHGEFFPDVC